MCIVINKGLLQGKAKLYGIEINNKYIKLYGENNSCETLFLDNLRSYVVDELHEVIRDEMAKMLINKTQATFNYNKLIETFTFDRDQPFEGSLYFNKAVNSKGDGKGTVYLGVKGKNNRNLLIMSLKDIKLEGNKLCLNGLNESMKISVEVTNVKDLEYFRKRLSNVLSSETSRYIKYVDIDKLLIGIEHRIYIG